MGRVDAAFFDLGPCQLARALLGKVLRRRLEGRWLAARIIETEAYSADDKAAHSWLGRTPSREPMWMPPGTIYMYHSRGGPSLNLSAAGPGAAVLVKAAAVHVDRRSPKPSVELMHRLNPTRSGDRRPVERLCSGQSLLCRSLGLQVEKWNGRAFDAKHFYLDDVGHAPEHVLVARRLGIAPERDAHRLRRFIDAADADRCTKDPRRVRGAKVGTDYRIEGRLKQGGRAR